MITSINRIAQELQAIATAHLQLQSFYYGDIVQTYNSLEGVKHSTLLCDIKNSTIYDGYTTVTIELMVLDRVLTHDVEVKNQPQQNVESNTKQIINDLYWIIRYSPRWQAFGMVEEGSAARKVVENTPDKVTGWFISINLRIRNQQGICDLPMIGYDYGTIVAPANCPGVTIIRDGQVIEIVDSGGTFSFTTGGDPCEIIGEATAQEIVDCLDPTQLEPLQDLICETPEPCPLGWSVVNSEEDTIITGIVSNPCNEPSLTIPIGDVTYYDCNNELQTTPYPNVPDTPINEPCPPCEPLTIDFNGAIITVVDPCGENVPVTCESITDAVFVSGAGSDVNGLYTLGSGNVNDKIWWENTTTGTIIVWSGEQWQIRNDDNTVRYYTDSDGAIWPWLGTWIVSQGESPAPTVTQATVQDALDCCEDCTQVSVSINGSETTIDFSEVDGCPKLVDIDVEYENGTPIGTITGGKVIVPNPAECEGVAINVDGSLVDTYPDGSTVDVNVVSAGGNVNILQVTQPSALEIEIEVRWRPSALVDHITLAENNPFGNTKNYTGLTGGYKVGANYFDKDGVATTEALAFPFNLVCVWSLSRYNDVYVVERTLNTLISGGNFNTVVTPSIAALNASNYAGHNDWNLPTIAFGAMVPQRVNTLTAMSFDPFNQATYTGITLSMWLQEERLDLTTNQYFAQLDIIVIGVALKTQNRGAKAFRRYTFAELGI